MADERNIIVALPLGADALNMRARFCATVEATIRQNVTQHIVGASELDTVLGGRM
jgi:NAD(P)H-dependent flavin oxidoreductase YrpB (nitropropane dioxygenase family)